MMLSNYSISPHEQTAYVTVQGAFDLHSSTETFGALTADSDFTPSYQVLVDLREMKFTPSGAELRMLASILTSNKGRLQGKVALITSQLHFYSARLTCLIAEAAGCQTRAFPGMCAAKKWARKH